MIRELLAEAIDYLFQMPSLNVDAKEDDTSPEDAAGHVAGLVLRRLLMIQEMLEANQGTGADHE